MSGLEVARADMESADSAAPIATSGKREAAGEVIGVKRCGGDPVGHDERSISWQVVVGLNDTQAVQAGLVKAVRCIFLLKRATP